MPGFDSFGYLDWMHFVLAIYLFIHGICTLNFMSKRTPIPRRLGYSIFTVGAFSMLLAPVYGVYHPSAGETLMCLGLVIYYGYSNIVLWRYNARKLSRALRKS